MMSAASFVHSSYDSVCTHLIFVVVVVALCCLSLNVFSYDSSEKVFNAHHKPTFNALNMHRYCPFYKRKSTVLSLYQTVVRVRNQFFQVFLDFWEALERILKVVPG